MLSDWLTFGGVLAGALSTSLRCVIVGVCNYSTVTMRLQCLSFFAVAACLY